MLPLQFDELFIPLWDIHLCQEYHRRNALEHRGEDDCGLVVFELDYILVIVNDLNLKNCEI